MGSCRIRARHVHSCAGVLPWRCRLFRPSSAAAAGPSGFCRLWRRASRLKSNAAVCAGWAGCRGQGPVGMRMRRYTCGFGSVPCATALLFCTRSGVCVRALRSPRFPQSNECKRVIRELHLCTSDCIQTRAARHSALPWGRRWDRSPRAGARLRRPCQGLSEALVAHGRLPASVGRDVRRRVAP